MNFKEQIAPFRWISHTDSFSLCLNANEYKNEIFEARKEEGFEGNGYDWQSLAAVFLEEQFEEIASLIHFDSEADMFCAYSKEEEALKKYALAFKEVCENHSLITDIFSRAELD